LSNIELVRGKHGVALSRRSIEQQLDLDHRDRPDEHHIPAVTTGSGPIANGTYCVWRDAIM
jgi:hypothetical protein